MFLVCFSLVLLVKNPIFKLSDFYEAVERKLPEHSEVQYLYRERSLHALYALLLCGHLFIYALLLFHSLPSYPHTIFIIYVHSLFFQSRYTYILVRICLWAGDAP